jgi:hypothetical protein
MSAIFLHHNENLSHVPLMLIIPKNFSFLLTLNSVIHGHVLTRKLALLFIIAKQVLERKTMSFRIEITTSRFSRTNCRVYILRLADDPSIPILHEDPLTISSTPSPLAVALHPLLTAPGSPHS